MKHRGMGRKSALVNCKHVYVVSPGPDLEGPSAEVTLLPRGDGLVTYSRSPSMEERELHLSSRNFLSWFSGVFFVCTDIFVGHVP